MAETSMPNKDIFIINRVPNSGISLRDFRSRAPSSALCNLYHHTGFRYCGCRCLRMNRLFMRGASYMGNDPMLAVAPSRLKFK